MPREYLQTMKWFPFLALATSLSALAQEGPVPAVSSLHKIHFLNACYEWEARLTDRTTLSLNAGLGFTIYGQSQPPDSKVQWNWVLFPVGHVQYRHYYNLQKRASRGRSTRGNSGNFLTAGFLWSTRSLAERNITMWNGLHPMVGWGLQRTYRKNFHLQWVLGAALYSFNAVGSGNSYSEFGPMIQLKLGYAFAKK